MDKLIVWLKSPTGETQHGLECRTSTWWPFLSMRNSVGKYVFVTGGESNRQHSLCEEELHFLSVDFMKGYRINYQTKLIKARMLLRLGSLEMTARVLHFHDLMHSRTAIKCSFDFNLSQWVVVLPHIQLAGKQGSKEVLSISGEDKLKKSGHLCFVLCY